MKIKSNDFIFVTGKANTGKTFWIKGHLKAIPKNRPVVIYDFNQEFTEETKKAGMGVWLVQRGTTAEAEDFVQMAYNAGNCTVVLSESDNYLRAPSPVIKAFVTTGRNRGINAIVDAKRPMSVPPDYRGRFNKLVLFRTTLPDDIEYLEKWAGTGKGSLQLLTTLEQGEFVIIDTDEQSTSPVKKL